MYSDLKGSCPKRINIIEDWTGLPKTVSQGGKSLYDRDRTKVVTWYILFDLGRTKIDGQRALRCSLNESHIQSGFECDVYTYKKK